MSLYSAMKTNPYPGKFIVLEGPDGSGKTTQAWLLCKKLHEKHIKIYSTKEPTDYGMFGKLARFLYSTDENVRTQKWKYVWLQLFKSNEYRMFRDSLAHAQFIYVARFETYAEELAENNKKHFPLLIQLGMIFDRLEHRIGREIPALKNGTVVVSDRDFLSTLAYGGGEGLDWRELLKMHEHILGNNFIVPDLILLLAITPKIGITRTLEKQGGKREHFDGKIAIVTAAYHEITTHPLIRNRIQIAEIDGALPKEAVHALICRAVQSLLK